MPTSRLIALSVLLCACGHPPSVAAAPASESDGTDELVELDPWLTALGAPRASDTERRARIGGLDRRSDASDAAFGATDERCEGEALEPSVDDDTVRVDAQLDDDAELETIVRVSASLALSPTERCEHVWLGVFDPAGARHRFRGALRLRALHCLDDGEERESMLTLSVESTGPILERQRVLSCGTLVDYDYARYRIVLREDRPAVVEAGSVEGRRQDRLADLARADPAPSAPPARDPSAIAPGPIPARDRLDPCHVVLRHTTYDEESRAPSTQTLPIRRLVRRWTDDLREREWHDVAPIPLTLAQARTLLPEPTEFTGQRGVEVFATVGDGQLMYRFDARGRALVVDWDPTADSSTYEYRYSYGCAAGSGRRPFYADDRDPD